MKIVSNPPFKINRKKFKALLLSADDYVVLHTFRFCNNELGRFELIEYKEWPEVTNIVIAIAASTMKRNYIERPVFYQNETRDHMFENCEDYVAFCNTHFADGQYHKAVKQNRPNRAKKLIFKDITEDLFINKGANKFTIKGDRIKRVVYPRSFIKIFEKHLDEIYMDTKLFGNIMIKYPLVRKEFIDDTETKVSIQKDS